MAESCHKAGEGEEWSGVLLMCRSSKTLGILASILTRAGSTALTAQNSTDAWECIHNGSVGCVVLDLTNATHDSFSLFRACRSSRNFFHIPFLFLTPPEYIAPKFEGTWPETARDAWLALPCPAQQFLQGVRSLLAANLPHYNRTGIDQLPVIPITTMTQRSPITTSRLNSSSGLHRVETPAHGTVTPPVLAPHALFSGRLGKLQFSQILGLIEPLLLTGTLKINDGVRIGCVYFVDGKVHHAELNEIVGSEALFLLFHLNKGTFQFDVAPPTANRTVEGNTMSLLLEGMRKMDEAKAMVSAIKERQVTGAFSSISSRSIERVG